MGTRPCCTVVASFHESIELVNRHLNTNTRVSCYSSFVEFGWLAYSLDRAGFRHHENTFMCQKNLQFAICLALSQSDSQHLIWHITVKVDAKGEIIYHDRVTWFHITLTQFKSGVPGHAIMNEMKFFRKICQAQSAASDSIGSLVSGDWWSGAAAAVRTTSTWFGAAIALSGGLEIPPTE